MRFDQAKRYGLIHGVITEGIYGSLLACPYLPTRDVALSRTTMKQIFITDTDIHKNMSRVKATLMQRIRDNGPNFDKMDPSEFPDIPKLIPAEAYIPMGQHRPANPTSMHGPVEQEDDWGEEYETGNMN